MRVSKWVFSRPRKTISPYSSTLNATWTIKERTFLFWSILWGTRTRKQTFVLRWETYHWSENVANLSDFWYCRRTYYQGVIFTQICKSGSVHGYGIPRNFQLLSRKAENCISIVWIQYSQLLNRSSFTCHSFYSSCSLRTTFYTCVVTQIILKIWSFRGHKYQGM